MFFKIHEEVKANEAVFEIVRHSIIEIGKRTGDLAKFYTYAFKMHSKEILLVYG